MPGLSLTKNVSLSGGKLSSMSDGPNIDSAIGRSFSKSAVGMASTISSTAVMTAPFGHGKIFPGGCVARTPVSDLGTDFFLNQLNKTIPSLFLRRLPWMGLEARCCRLRKGRYSPDGRTELVCRVWAFVEVCRDGVGFVCCHIAAHESNIFPCPKSPGFLIGRPGPTESSILLPLKTLKIRVTGRGFRLDAPSLPSAGVPVEGRRCGVFGY